MTEKTVTVGDTEVEIRETEDGFEAVEVGEDDALHIRFQSLGGTGGYGCEIPVDADYKLESKDESAATVYWHEEDDRSELDGWDAGRRGYDYDLGAHVSGVEFVKPD